MVGRDSVGVVERVGPAVDSCEAGQRVAVNAITPCFKCDNCIRGYPSQCTDMLGGWKFANVRDGVFAPYFEVNDAEANLAPIPDGVADEQAAYTCDMMSTGLAGAENAGLPVGGTAAVFAQGPVGLMATVGCRLQGAGLVIAVESMPNRKELAEHFGADDIVDFTEVDPVEAIRELTGGVGVDSAVEALGGQATFTDCIEATRPGRTISNIGYHGEGETVDIPREAWGVGMSDKTINTALCPGGKVRMKRLMRLLERGRVDPTPMTTHQFGFDEIDRAFEMMENKEDGMIKPLIRFG